MTRSPSFTPLVARLLGYFGLIPFLAMGLDGLIQVLPAGWGMFWRSYAALILSFMGGAQWGLAVGAEEGRRDTAQRYGVSVAPALLAWTSLALTPRVSLAFQIVGFLALLAYDVWTVRQGAAPPWYARLRIRLTSVVCVCLAAGMIHAGR